MSNNQTALTRKLEPSRRQFLQWHFIEKLSIAEVKERMDKLTIALQSAGYDYDFTAEEKAWASRSVYWNKKAKIQPAWKVKAYQKGRGLPIPIELIHVPVWIEWDEDVGNWRSNNPTTSPPSRIQMAHVDGYRQSYDDNGYGGGVSQYLATTMPRTSIQSFYASPESAPSILQAPHLAIPMEGLRTTPQSPNPRIDGSSTWLQNYPAATVTPSGHLSLSKARRATGCDLEPLPREQELSNLNSHIYSAAASGSAIQGYMGGGQPEHTRSYAPQPSVLPYQHQPRSAELLTPQTPQPRGLPVYSWNPTPFDGPQYDSTSWQGGNGK